MRNSNSETFHSMVKQQVGEIFEDLQEVSSIGRCGIYSDVILAMPGKRLVWTHLSQHSHLDPISGGRPSKPTQIAESRSSTDSILSGGCFETSGATFKPQ